MNRAQMIQEIFIPRPGGPSPDFSTFLSTTSEHPIRYFRHTLHLPGGPYEIIMGYEGATGLLSIAYTKDGSIIPPRSGSRTLDQTKQETRDFFHLIRAIVQMIQKIVTDYPIRIIGFDADIVPPERIVFYDHLAPRLAQSFHGRLVTDIVGNRKLYRIVLTV